MSTIQPTKPYVYQPDPVNSPYYPRIYALSGPGVPEEYQGKRYTKEDAHAILEKITDRFKPGDRVKYYGLMYPRRDFKGTATVQAYSPMHGGGQKMVWLDGVRSCYHPDACELIERTEG